MPPLTSIALLQIRTRISQPTGSTRDADLYLGKVSFVPVPEPSSVAMSVSCLLALAALRRRK
ncbi:PEP-CTERM sorting domain-containing protein [Lacipirellula limnantheis]|uniref:PEP-CTERM sorting domain-containing protein n=1 Tax=Lacipirellula limnantheis TaxID=2528024 RepID=UPI00119F4C60